MNAEEFIHAIKLAVRDAAINNTIDVLARPPGRKPSQELLRTSEWYNSLDARGRAILAEIVAIAVDDAIFGFLCVLDGVRAIEDTTDKGRLELSYIKDGVEVLNDSNLMLHDIYNE
jgi:hypothetical protein